MEIVLLVNLPTLCKETNVCFQVQNQSSVEKDKWKSTTSVMMLIETVRDGIIEDTALNANLDSSKRMENVPNILLVVIDNTGMVADVKTFHIVVVNLTNGMANASLAVIAANIMLEMEDVFLEIDCVMPLSLFIFLIGSYNFVKNS